MDRDRRGRCGGAGARFGGARGFGARAMARARPARRAVRARRGIDVRVRCDRGKVCDRRTGRRRPRSEEHTSELQSLMPISYAVFRLKKKQFIFKILYLWLKLMK